MAVQALENKIISLDCTFIDECEIFKCFEFTKLMNIIYAKKLTYRGMKYLGAKNSRFSSLNMCVISDMMEDENTNLKEAFFKFIRSIFAHQIYYIHYTI